MIISRTPLRVSFLGGGTDYKQWYETYGGAIIGTTIDKYVYVALHNGKMWDISDLPTKSGLATSSAFTVGLLRVCSNLDKTTLANVATLWEQEKMGYNVGSQDQYLCSVGGFLHLRFDENSVRATPLYADPLESYLMLFDTHVRRISGDVISHQLDAMERNKESLSLMMGLVDEGVAAINSANWLRFGELIDKAWELKKDLSSFISTTKIDSIYATAKKAGAIGGKILGGGGGGFMLFFVHPNQQEAVKKALSNLTYVPFKFEKLGSEVIYSD